MSIPTIKLNDGNEMPAIGLGTYINSPEGNECEQAVKDAIDLGYRHIDTAFFYKNEKVVGSGIRAKIDEGVIKREDIFVVTKLWNTFHWPEHVEIACKKSYENLGVGKIDLYLMHTPMAYEYRGFEPENLMPYNADGTTLALSEDDYIETWKAMEKLVEIGLVKSIGVSNFNSEQITRLLSIAKIKPVCNQVECNPNINQKKLIKFCKDLDIVVVAYCPLRMPANDNPNSPKAALSDDNIKAIAKKYNKSTAQIILRYLIENGAVPIPKSVTKQRIADNKNVFDFKLTADEKSVLDNFETGKRSVPFLLNLANKNYPFNIEY